MFPIKYNPSIVGQIIFPSIQWRSECNKILLTIDDCPNAGLTEQILKHLDDMRIQALFFAIGRNIKQTGSLLAEISSAGHAIGNHGFNHKDLRKMQRNEIHDEIARTSECISNISGVKPKYFRPPYGSFNKSVLAECRMLGLQPVLWSLITYDYKNDLNLLKFAFRYLKKNAIIVMHDNTKNASVVRDEIYSLHEYIHQHNFEFGTPQECLR